MRRSFSHRGRQLARALVPFAAVGTVACASLLDIDTNRRFVEDKAPDAGGEMTQPDAQPAKICTGSIPLKILYDATGATSTVSVPYFWGEFDFLREINESGGIGGCKVDIESRDYAYSPTNAVSIYNEWKARPEWSNVVTVFGFGSGDTAALGPLVRVDKKVLISASYAGDIATPEPINKSISVPEVGAAPAFVEGTSNVAKTSDGYPYNFFAGTDSSTAIRVGVYYVSLAGGQRIGFGQCTSSLYCTSPLAAGKSYALQKGLGIGRDVNLPLSGAGSSDAEYLTTLRQYFQEELDHKVAVPSYKPVDWLWLGNTSATVARAMKALAVVNQEKGLQVKAITNTFGFDELLFASCGSACVDNLFGLLPFAVYGDLAASEMTKVMALHDKWRARDLETAQREGATDGGDASVPALQAYKNVRYVQGYVSALLWKAGAERALSSGKAISGESIKEALETLNRFDTGGLTDKLTFKARDHRPQSTEVIYKVDVQGKLVRVPPDRTIFLEDQWLGW